MNAPDFNQTTGTPPSNFLVPAILSTIFCCLPFGIVGIVFASQVNTKFAAGDYAGAAASASKARMWTYISIGVGIVTIVLSIALGGLGALTGANVQ